MSIVNQDLYQHAMVKKAGVALYQDLYPLTPLKHPSPGKVPLLCLPLMNLTHPDFLNLDSV